MTRVAEYTTKTAELFVEDWFNPHEQVAIHLTPLAALPEDPIVSEHGWCSALKMLKRSLDEKFKTELSLGALNSEGGTLTFQLWKNGTQGISGEDVEWAISTIMRALYLDEKRVPVLCKRKVSLMLPYPLRDKPAEALGENASASVSQSAF